MDPPFFSLGVPPGIRPSSLLEYAPRQSGEGRILGGTPREERGGSLVVLLERRGRIPGGPLREERGGSLVVLQERRGANSW